MLLLLWVVLFVVGICLILLMPTVWGKQVFDTFRGNRGVNCPETRSPVVVRFDALRAAFTSLSGKPQLRLANCSRWPVRADCGQDCIPDAAKSAPIAADTASFFTTDGIGVAISAPGEDQENIKFPYINSVGILSAALGGGTTRMSGTSMAAAVACTRRI